jgi:hypothetical protein
MMGGPCIEMPSYLALRKGWDLGECVEFHGGIHEWDRVKYPEDHATISTRHTIQKCILRLVIMVRTRLFKLRKCCCFVKREISITLSYAR